jgi:hypothetical protein
MGRENNEMCSSSIYSNSQYSRKGKKFLIKAVMHFTAVLVLESGMVRVVSFSIVFYLDHECGKQLFCG